MSRSSSLGYLDDGEAPDLVPVDLALLVEVPAPGAGDQRQGASVAGGTTDAPAQLVDGAGGDALLVAGGVLLAGVDAPASVMGSGSSGTLFPVPPPVPVVDAGGAR